MLSKIDSKYIDNVFRLLEMHKSSINSEKTEKLLDIIETKNEIEVINKFLSKVLVPSKRLSLLIVKYTWHALKFGLEKVIEPSFSNISYNCDLIKVIRISLNYVTFYKL